MVLKRKRKSPDDDNTGLAEVKPDSKRVKKSVEVAEASKKSEAKEESEINKSYSVGKTDNINSDKEICVKFGKRHRPASKVSRKQGRKVSAIPSENDVDFNRERHTCWLMKSEPETRIENGVDVKFGLEDLKACPDQTSYWDGVRNYQARNFMRDEMKVGDKVFFYHSNVKIPGIVGVCSIVKEAYPDHTQFDRKSPYYDSKSDKDNPRWIMVDVKYKYDLNRYITLHELKQLHLDHKANGGPLKNIALFTKARLSVQPVTQEEWNFIQKLSEESVA